MRPFWPSMQWSGALLTGTTPCWSAVASASAGFRALASVDVSGSLLNSCGYGAVFDMRRSALPGIFGVAPLVGGLEAGGEG